MWVLGSCLRRGASGSWRHPAEPDGSLLALVAALTVLVALTHPRFALICGSLVRGHIDRAARGRRRLRLNCRQDWPVRPSPLPGRSTTTLSITGEPGV